MTEEQIDRSSLPVAEYEPPPIDEAKDEELRDWIDRQKAGFPDSNV